VSRKLPENRLEERAGLGHYGVPHIVQPAQGIPVQTAVEGVVRDLRNGLTRQEAQGVPGRRDT